MPYRGSPGDYYTDFNPCVLQRFEVAPLGRQIDPYFGATEGPLEREEAPLDPIETARRQICSRQLNIPHTRTAGNWREVDEASARGESYQDRYLQLSANVAVKYPNPGRPRERMGRIGGTWRHIREVLGYTGSQVCFVDGLVSLYDTDNKKSGLHLGPAWRARGSGPTGYSANMAGQDLTNYLQADDKSTDVLDTSKYKGFYTMRQ